jgi:hypothetical protein
MVSGEHCWGTAVMVFEVAGFLCGAVGIAAALVLLYRRQANRTLEDMQQHANHRARV